MNLKPLQDRLALDISDLEGLLKYVDEVDEKQKSLDRQHQVFFQKQRALEIKEAEHKKQVESVKKEEKRILDVQGKSGSNKKA